MSNVTDLITLNGYSQTGISYDFDLLDKDLYYLGKLEVSAGSTVTIENNINRTIKRQMDGIEILPNILTDINTLSDRVRPYMRLQDGTRWPLGVFVFSDASYARLSRDSGTRHLTMLDLGAIIDQGVERTYSFLPGRPIEDCIHTLLQASPITEYVVEGSGSSIGGEEGVTWPAGTELLSIINDLCGMGSYYSLYFDNNGVGQVKLVPDLGSEEAVLRYGSVPGEQRVKRETIIETDDLLAAPNRYIVTNTSFNDIPIVGYWDIPSPAPHSIANRGYVVSVTKDVQGLESVDQAMNAAKAYGQSDYNTYQWATFDAAPDPRHDTFDIVSWEGVNYREQSWRLAMEPDASHTHELRRIYTEIQV